MTVALFYIIIVLSSSFPPPPLSLSLDLTFSCSNFPDSKLNNDNEYIRPWRAMQFVVQPIAGIMYILGTKSTHRPRKKWRENTHEPAKWE